MSDKSELVESIESAVSGSGLLFQRHPAHGEWDTTRPGARVGEVACFVHRGGELNSYISVQLFLAGEEDEDGYEWEQDSYVLEFMRGDGSCDRDVATNKERMAELVAEEMERIAA